jgi:LuxR family maltose regulon positive regulatory protein
MSEAAPRTLHRPPAEIHPRAPMAVKLDVPPLRRANVDRTTLLARLTPFRGVGVVVTPPGFGKTTLLAQWQRSDPRPFAWLTLDAADNDPVVLWTYIKLAVDSLLAAGRDDGPVADESPVDLDVVVLELIGALKRVDSDVVVVLDDFHLITDPICLALLARFLEGRPSNVSVVLAARSDLGLPIGQMRVDLDLLELRAADLAFTLDETRAFLNGALGLGLSDAAVRLLWRRTEGWPAGAYLAYLSLRDAPDPEAVAKRFGGSSRRVVEYMSEIIDRQDERTRDFLLGSSVLDRMNGPLCDHVLDTHGAAELLERLERADLFVVALDDHRQWYRYHRLFRDLLQDELHRRQPARIAELHRRASEELRTRDPGGAMRHALAAGRVGDAAMILSESYVRTLEWGGLSTIERWLAAFPRSEVIADARLSVVEAWVFSFRVRYPEADIAMENALRTAYAGPLPDGAGSLEASAALLRASAPRGDVGEMLRAAQTAFDLEGHAGSMWEVTTHVQLGWALLLSGRFDEARPLLERAALRAPMTEQWLNAFGAKCLLAWAALWDPADDRIDEVERWADDAVGIAKLVLRRNATSEWAYATLGAVRAAQGRLDEADELLSRAIGHLRHAAAPLLIAAALLALGPVKRALGDAAEARRVVDEARTIIDTCADPGVLRRLLDDVAKGIATQRRRVTAAPLTAREHEVLQLLESGLSKRDIARELFLSFNTIHSHMRAIYRKLGVESRADAIRRAREAGILDAPASIV